MRDLIINPTGTGAFAEVPSIPRKCYSITIQARSASDNVLLLFRGQVTYWTIKADTVRTFVGEYSQGDIFINAPVGVIVEIIFSTKGYSSD